MTSPTAGTGTITGSTSDTAPPEAEAAAAAAAAEQVPSLPYDLEMREEIQVLMVIKFTSKRKRMSVIIRDTDGNIKLLIKGADTAMLASRTPNTSGTTKQTITHVEQFSNEGLRCLLVGYKEIDELTFEDWGAAGTRRPWLV